MFICETSPSPSPSVGWNGNLLFVSHSTAAAAAAEAQKSWPSIKSDKTPHSSDLQLPSAHIVRRYLEGQSKWTVAKLWMLQVETTKTTILVKTAEEKSFIFPIKQQPVVQTKLECRIKKETRRRKKWRFVVCVCVCFSDERNLLLLAVLLSVCSFWFCSVLFSYMCKSTKMKL